MTVRTALLQGVRLLEDSQVAVPRLTAEVLLAHAVGCRKEWLYAHGGDELKEVWWIHFGRYLHERMNGKPTQYITKTQEFYGRDFRVTPAVLIPRPETEHVVEAALSRLDGPAIDVGTGSGVIAVTLALESGRPIFATDISGEALAVATANASKLGAKVEFVRADLLDCLANCSLQLVVSNPPYIPETESESLQREVRDFEPHLALFGGVDGMDVYGRLITGAWRVLRPGGWLVMELAYNVGGKVNALMEDWQLVELVPDLAGHPRVIVGRKV